MSLDLRSSGMESTKRTEIWPRPALGQLAAYKRPPLAPLFLLFVLAAFTALILSVRAAGALQTPPQFSKTWFNDIAPGMSRIALEALGYCQPNGYAEEQCIADMDSIHFKRVSALVVGGAIQHIDFEVRNQNLRLGDMVMVLGQPSIEVQGSYLYLRWRDGISALATMHTGRETLLLPLHRVSLGRVEF
jgi:hypothetical protein